MVNRILVSKTKDHGKDLTLQPNAISPSFFLSYMYGTRRLQMFQACADQLVGSALLVLNKLFMGDIVVWRRLRLITKRKGKAQKTHTDMEKSFSNGRLVACIHATRTWIRSPELFYCHQRLVL